MSIQDALRDFSEALSATAPERLRELSPGLGAPEILHTLSPLTQHPPGELVALYQWRDGYEPEAPSWPPMFLGWRPVRLAKAVEWNLRFREMDAENVRRYGPANAIGRSGWLGIFEQPGDLVLNADLDGVGPGGEVPIYRSYVKDLETRFVASSLADLIGAWTALLAAGATWDGNQWNVPTSVDRTLIAAAGY